MKDYVKIILKDRFVMPLTTMNSMMEKLPKGRFVRIHRSYIVSLSSIDSIEKNRVTIAGKKLPVGNLYKSQLMNALGKT